MKEKYLNQSADSEWHSFNNKSIHDGAVRMMALGVVFLWS